MKFLKKYVASRSGSFAIKMAIITPMILLCVGMVIDMSRLVSAKQKLQGAVDSSALSASIVYTDEKGKYKKVAKESLLENMDPQQTLKKFKVNLSDNENTIQVTATSKVKPMFVQMFGYPKLNVSAFSETNILGISPTELALVVDHTASLKWNGGLPYLNSALDVFMDTVADDNDMGDLYLSFIPWGGTVNVGSEHSAWLNPHDTNVFGNDNWHGCVMARDDGQDTTDTPPTGTSKFDPYSWPDTNNWQGIDPSGFRDYVSDVTTWPYGPNGGCAVPMVPLTNNRSLIEDAIDEYQSHIMNITGTFTPAAMAWGHRAVSSKWRGHWKGPTPQTLPSNDAKKIIVFLSDGLANWNTIHKTMAENSEFTPYGYPEDNFLGLNDPHDRDEARKEMDKRFLEICNNAKADGIEIYTIGFAMQKSLTNIYKECATSEDHFFHSESSQKISEVFSKIGKNIKEKQPRIIN